MANKSIEDMYMELVGEINSEDLKADHYRKNNLSNDDLEEFTTDYEIHQEEQEDELRLNGKILPKKPPVIEEDVHFQTYSRPREHKYTEKELERIRESCKSSIVHDYGEFDVFHISDEERARNNMLSSLAVKLGSMKSIYNKVDQYIEAMRVVRQAWDILEQHNYIHTKEEFFKLVAEGRIVSSQIIMPKLKRMNTYNIDMIIKYISNPELDPKDLVPKVPVINDYDEWDEEMSEEDEMANMMRLLSPEEIEYLHEYDDNPPEIKVHVVKNKYVRGYDRRNFLSMKRKRAKLKKTDQYIADGLHDILNKIQSNHNNRESGYATYTITHSMFDVSKDKENKDFWDDLRFNGSFANKYDNELYDIIVYEAMMQQRVPSDPNVTFSDLSIRDFFRDMENAGLNVLEMRRQMNCSANDDEKRSIKQRTKDNKKIESEILQRITKLNNNEKFKRLIHKAEKNLNKYQEDN